MKKVDKEIKGLGVSRELIEHAADVLGKTPTQLVNKLKKSHPVVEREDGDGRVSFFEGLQRNMSIQEEIDNAMYDNLINMVGYCKLQDLNMIMGIEGFANRGFLIAPKGRPTPFAIQKAKFFTRFQGDDPKERPKDGKGKTPLIRLCNANNCTATTVRKASEKAARSCHTTDWIRIEKYPILLSHLPEDETLQLLMKHGLAMVEVKVEDSKQEEARVEDVDP